jgi:ribA/ribD-fused uncharacterized protein
MADEIRFYKKTDPFWEFGNMAAAPFTVEGVLWKTSEHYFQAQKFPDNSEYQEQIRQTASPMIAKRLGSSRKIPIRTDWNTYRLVAMKKALTEKFRQNESLCALLLSTGSKKLVEASPKDSFWGAGASGTGENWLGKLLMEVRDDLLYPRPGKKVFRKGGKL